MSTEDEVPLHDTIVYQYGLLDPLDWAEDCREVLWQQTHLWNQLVEIERDSRQRYRAALGGHAHIASLQTQLATLLERQSTLRDERKRLRQSARSSARESAAAILERLRDLARTIQPLQGQLQAARQLAKKDMSGQLAALEGERKHRVDAARRQSPLWYPNSNAVINAYNIGRRRAIKDGVELRFHPFTGEGRFTTQLIGGRSIADIEEGRCSQVRVDLSPQPVPGRGGRALERLAIAIAVHDRRPRLLTFPLIYDRPLPSQATVQDVTVTRKRLGTRFRYKVVFKLRVKAQSFVTHRAPEHRCGINLGFRERPDGTLRIGMLRDERGVFRELTLPAGIRRVRDRLDSLRSARDTHLEAIMMRLRAHWPARPDGAPAALMARMTALLRTPKVAARRLAPLVWFWRTDPECNTYWPSMLDQLAAWRRADKRVYEHESNEAEQILGQRRHHYRDLARELCREFGEVRVGKIDLKGLARLEGANGEANELHGRARRNRHRAALHQFQSELRQQAVKSGTVLIEIAPPYASVCHRCGESIPSEADLIVSCPQGHVWDQDELAAANILAASSERFSAFEDAEERSRRRKQALIRQRERMARMVAARKAKHSQTTTDLVDSDEVSSIIETMRA